MEEETTNQAKVRKNDIAVFLPSLKKIEKSLLRWLVLVLLLWLVSRE
jgi:hypothetical protein